MNEGSRRGQCGRQGRRCALSEQKIVVIVVIVGPKRIVTQRGIWIDGRCAIEVAETCCVLEPSRFAQGLWGRPGSGWGR
jgi:hypothetical protein